VTKGRTVLVVALIALAAFAITSSAQDIDRSKRPIVDTAPTFKFPNVETHTLANGLRLILVEDHALPLVSTRIVLGADSTADPAGKESLFAITVGALREGTTSMSADQLADAFADVGTTVTPTGFTTTTVAFARGLALAGDMLMHPLLNQAAVDRRKAAQSAIARRIAQTPVTLPRHLFYAALFGANDPYVRSLVPTEASVASITRDDVMRFYDEHVHPNTTTIVIVGDVRGTTALAEVTRVFGAWRSQPASSAREPAPPITAHPTTIYLCDVPGTQAYLYIGTTGPAQTSPDFYAMDLAATISGTRMQQTLRENRSFMYSGNAGLVSRRGAAPSAYVGSTSLNAVKVDSALAEWLTLLRGLSRERPVTPQELEAVRHNRVGALPARIDGPDSLAARLVELVRDGLPLDFYDQYAARLGSVTESNVTAAASKFIDPEHLIIVVTGDRTKLEPALRAANLAPVVVVDPNGKPIER
jgi:zinc protease